MHAIFLNNCIVDMTQPHFSSCYTYETEILKSKAEILKNLIPKQKKMETKLTHKLATERVNANVSNSMPEISSMYYSEQIAAQDTIIHEVGEQHSESDVLSEFSSDQHQNVPSEVESLLEAGSEYHLKQTFK